MRFYEFYPVHIIPSRYGGTYEGGSFILIAGVENPRENTHAFGSDNDCAGFWRKVRSEGPVVQTEVEGESIDIYAESGSSPSTLYDRFSTFSESLAKDRVADIVTEVIQDQQQIVSDARSGDVLALHKLAALCQALTQYRHSSSAAQFPFIQEELASRFLEYDSVPAIMSLSSSELESVQDYVKSYDSNLRIPIAYS